MEEKTQEESVKQQQPIITPKILKSFPRKILVIFIILFILITLGATAFYFLKLKSSKEEPNPIACTQEAKLCPDGSYVSRTGPNYEFRPCPNPTNKGDARIQAQTADWKKYTNTKYGFELTYPAKGVIQGEKGQYEGECGKAIKDNSEGILFDNLFQIQILNWDGTINDYITQKGAKNKYDFKEILNSNADEASEVIGIKKGLELSSVGYPPLMYISNIYKKGDNLFIIMHKTHPPEPINPNGCMNPKDLDYTKYPKYANQALNITTSFKFIDQKSSDISNWKTYANSNLSFKYPSDWSKSTIGVDTITSNSPKIKIIVASSGSALMNECMQETSVETLNGLTVKKFIRVTTGAMCGTPDSTPREIWVVPSKEKYEPGISFQYSSTESEQAEKFFDQILLTFKFTQ